MENIRYDEIDVCLEVCAARCRTIIQLSHIDRRVRIVCRIVTPVDNVMTKCKYNTPINVGPLNGIKRNTEYCALKQKYFHNYVWMWKQIRIVDQWILIDAVELSTAAKYSTEFYLKCKIPNQYLAYFYRKINITLGN